ncbi:DNA polymerase delta small subunit [Habropoda laboriosa]|uniref:DNA polymerase delta small subunit n=1 Tax=Habropoda laboriosa TaxID=597456 RepID=A0A0L7QN92_9HYME|nr:PREDICTED: DNA polymerase delta small subunit-like [Habropoda laboriosa]KOC60112.1 DNA polymerase delta small subunit [Habropoda laboriosa]
MVHKTEKEYNELCVKPGKENPPMFERKQTQYKDLSEKFVSTPSDYSKQFAHIYAARLAELRDILIPRVQAKWINVPIVKLADLENLDGQQCVIIGTLYKHQQWKPSILRELNEDHQLSVPCVKSDYCSEKDQPFLEDEMLRIKLEGEQVDLKHIVTGIVCAVLGNENSAGSFIVKGWCFPGCAPKESLKKYTSQEKVVIVSGLDLSNNYENLETSLFVEWLCGLAGNTKIQKDGTSIVRLIIAGNTIRSTDISNSKTDTDKGIGEAIKTADTFLSNLAKCCYITLMPGQHDPTNAMLPQKPFHPCLLPKSSRLESLKSTTNPWIGKIDERVIIGTSGQSIEDIIKATGETAISPIEWLEKTLHWRHVCPTAPDTLLACPYYKKDLFIMKECPDVYFVGNTEKFETKLWKGDENQTIRLISVPRFSTTHTAVIVSLENLDIQTISFGNI